MRFHSQQDMIYPGLYLQPGVYVGHDFYPKFYGKTNISKACNAFQGCNILCHI